MGKKIVRVILKALGVIALIIGAYFAINLWIHMIQNDGDILGVGFGGWVLGFTGSITTILLVVLGVGRLRYWSSETP